MKCAECEREIEQPATQLVQDYLCSQCRISLEPEQWDERERVTKAVNEWLRSRGSFYFGHEIMFPDNSPWAWVRIYDDSDMVEKLTGMSLTDVGAYDAYLNRLRIEWYYVWKKTGCVYNLDGAAISDDPIFYPSWT